MPKKIALTAIAGAGAYFGYKSITKVLQEKSRRQMITDLGIYTARFPIGRVHLKSIEGITIGETKYYPSSVKNRLNVLAAPFILGCVDHFNTHTGSGLYASLYKPGGLLGFSMQDPCPIKISSHWLSVSNHHDAPINELGEFVLGYSYGYHRHWRARPKRWKSHRDYCNWDVRGTAFAALRAHYIVEGESFVVKKEHTYRNIGGSICVLDLRGANQTTFIISTTPIFMEAISFNGKGYYSFPKKDAFNNIISIVPNPNSIYLYEVKMRNIVLAFKTNSDSVIQLYTDKYEANNDSITT